MVYNALFCLAPYCQCNRKGDCSSCNNADCPCKENSRRCHPRCRCRNNCMNAGKIVKHAHWDGKCSCGQTKPDEPHCLPLKEGGTRVRECPCRKFSESGSCNNQCRCKGCQFDKPETNKMPRKRAKRDDPVPFKRVASSKYSGYSEEGFPHGRWTEVESLTLIVLYKMAIRMHSSTEEIMGMYAHLATYSCHQPTRLPIRHKTPNKILSKLIHLNCDIEPPDENQETDHN